MFLFLAWVIGVALFMCGFLAVFFRRKRQEEGARGTGISILKPLKGADAGLAANLESFFRLQYPDFELIFSVADSNDPAVPVVEALRARYPAVLSRLIVGGVPALNPKVGNLIRPYELARHDLLLISDSNVRVPETYLQSLAEQMEASTGVLTSVVAGIGPEGRGGALEATYLNTFYARGLSLAFLCGKPCVIGKSMMFRKSRMEQFGGMKAMGKYLAEDFMIGEEMRKLGLQVKLAADPIRQFIGTYSVKEFWDRHLRWGRIRKAHAPLAFAFEPLGSPLLTALFGAFVFHGHYPFLALFAAHLLAFFSADALVARKVSGELHRFFWISWLSRELLFLPMWLAVASGNSVQWRGQRIVLRSGGEIAVEGSEWKQKQAEAQLSFGGRPQVRTRSKATITRAIGGSGRPKVMLPEA